LKHSNRQAKGFTVLECVFVILLMCVMTTCAVFNASGSFQNSKSDSAGDAVMARLRLARMMALTQRRNVQVTIDTSFSGPDNAQHIYTQVVALPGEPTQPMDSLELPGGAQFVLEAGVPDSPMQLGNNAPVYFGNAAANNVVMQFTSTGSFTDANNNLINGTIFIGIPNVPTTARAVTIMGGAGSVERFYWTGAQWVR
jgi:type II secretory pathway pseudopilin PulG